MNLADSKMVSPTARLLRIVSAVFVLLVVLVAAEGDLQEWLAARQEQIVAVQAKEAVVKTVVAYNKVLIQAHLASRAALLEDVATKQEIERVRKYISYNVLEKEKTLDNRLMSLDIVKVTLGQKGGFAVAKAKEEWTYSYLDKNTGKRVSVPERDRYSATYRLIKTDERWLVDKVEIED